MSEAGASSDLRSKRLRHRGDSPGEDARGPGRTVRFGSPARFFARRAFAADLPGGDDEEPAARPIARQIDRRAECVQLRVDLYIDALLRHVIRLAVAPEVDAVVRDAARGRRIP